MTLVHAGAVAAQGDPAGVEPLALSLGSSCSPSWVPTFGGRNGTDDIVRATTEYDDGNGLALYVGGSFDIAGGVVVNRIAKWDGASWSALDAGMSSSVLSLAVHDDGGGPALYAGGSFTIAGGVAVSRIAKWDGASWSALGAGVAGTVSALTVYDDGGGPALYAGGEFDIAGGVVAHRIAKWDGAFWSALGTGTNGHVRALAVHDDGGGPALYAGGQFSTAGGVPASQIAKWNGSSWSALGAGVSPGYVLALTVHDSGSGPALYAGGGFVMAGGVTVNHVAKWDGSSWSALGSGTAGTVYALAVFDDGGGPALYASGSSSSGPAKWDGSGWSAVGGGTGSGVFTMAVHDDGGGPALYAGGSFTLAGGMVANRIARWDGSSWGTLGEGLNDEPGVTCNGISNGVNCRGVNALAAYDDGSGTALYAGGYFSSASGVALNKVAKWDGSSWSALGSGMGGSLGRSVEAFAVFDDGSGPALLAGGNFTSAGGVTANNLAKWDGSSWSDIGGGMNLAVNALAEYDDGGGPALYAGGQFTSAGGIAANRIARWDGSSWSPLGSGIDGTAPVLVDALAVFDDGGGPALYAAGDFTIAGGVSANHVAKWDGSSWSALGTGLSGSALAKALVVHDDGSGPALYVAGRFTSAGGVTANNIARWNGSSWSALGDALNDAVRALLVHDDGGGTALYAGGRFTLADGFVVNHIARWDGSNWSALGSGMDPFVNALVALEDETGTALFAGGPFLSAFDSGDSYVAKWGHAVDLDPPALSCPFEVVALDGLGSAPGEIVTFSVTADDCQDPSPVVVCVPPSGSFFPRGTTLVTCTATDGAGNQSTCQFPVTVALKVRPR